MALEVAHVSHAQKAHPGDTTLQVKFKWPRSTWISSRVHFLLLLMCVNSTLGIDSVPSGWWDVPCTESSQIHKYLSWDSPSCLGLGEPPAQLPWFGMQTSGMNCQGSSAGPASEKINKIMGDMWGIGLVLYYPFQNVLKDSKVAQTAEQSITIVLSTNY